MYLVAHPSTTYYLERIVADEKMMDKAKAVFMDRLEKRRVKEVPIIEKKKVLAQVIDFFKYRKLKKYVEYP